MNPQIRELERAGEQEATFVETALKLGGASEEEAKKTGALDRADEQVEDLFAKKYQTSGSPAHRAVWDKEFPIELFSGTSRPASATADEVMRKSIEVVRRRQKDGTLMNEQKKITQETIDELGKVGYWGLLVEPQYGGSGTPFGAFARFLVKMGTVEPTIAGLASVHGCIGAVDPLRTFGSPEQKQEHLPKLASGQRVSAFALTEPAAGSDLTALRTKADLVGDNYIVNGEKLFITNAVPGRTVGLVCLIENKPAVLIVDLPEQEDETFQIKKYGLHALKHSYNQGLIFKNFKVPKRNRLVAKGGDGLTVAYHGLNRGRVAVCATAAASMRLMMANMLPWARYRKTYGENIAKRELVRRRLGRMAGFIVGCDALIDWCSWLLDEGYRGEMECTVAKIFGSESQKEAVIELFMKTHGGRAFLHGHMFGDNVHEYLAPCIYEGEGEMLCMGFFKSLIKDHGKEFYEPIGKALYAAGIKQPNMANPSHLMKLAPAAMPWLKWRMNEMVVGPVRAKLPSMPPSLTELAQFATDHLQRSRLEVDRLMQQYQLKLADRQCSMVELSQRIQSLIVMLTTCLWAAKQSDELVKTAAIVLGREIRRNITGKRPSAEDYRLVTKLGADIAEGGFSKLAGIDEFEILMPYDK
jgi:alkylation response protein AidB-like acyl-CoA dehydrogenase